MVEVAFYGVTNIAFRLEVNGMPAMTDATQIGPTGLDYGKKMTLTFPSAAARRIRLYFDGAIGLQAVRVPTGQSISKPMDTPFVGAVIGDSFVNGSGRADLYPAGAMLFDTWALRVLKALGCNRFVLAGIGGTGFVAGMDGASSNAYVTRVAKVLSYSPSVLVVSGSINDGTAAGSIQSAAEAFFDASAAVGRRYAIGTVRAGYGANHDAVKAAAEASGVQFIDMRGFIYGSGKVTAPNGTGNADLYIMSDGAHPTLSGHAALASEIISKLS